MRTILSILLSFTLLSTAPLPGPAAPEPRPGTEAPAGTETDMQEEAGGQQAGEDAAPENGETGTEETGETKETGEPPEETGGEPITKKEEKEGLQEKQEDQKTPGDRKAPKKNEKKETDAKGKADEAQPEEKKPGQEKAGPKESQGMEPAQEADGEPLEAVKEERSAGLIEVDLDQNRETACLSLRDGEILERKAKDGYHTAVSRKINCKHTSASISASAKCKKAANPLNPTEAELRTGVVLTGKLRNKSFTTKLVEDAGDGVNNTVTHLHLEVDVDAPGVGTLLLAGPYKCGDGYAGYAYFGKHYSYCPNTKNFYEVGDSHVWLGCTAGDTGIREYHPQTYSHKFNVYKYVPNSYKVKYDANGGDGTVAGQNATYDQAFALRPGSGFKLAGHTLTGWNTRPNGTGRAYGLGASVKNLTKENGGVVTLYAQWRPNRLTVRYNANGGNAKLNAPQQIGPYLDSWTYGNVKKDPADFALFGLSRDGYDRKDGAEWNTSPNGTGKPFDQDVGYLATDYAPGLTTADQDITLYAQWEPKTYTVTLDNQLKDPDKAGTGKVYKKYTKGMFLDSTCSQGATRITPPEKEGYKFTGYYDPAGKPMTDSEGTLTALAKGKKDEIGDETWQARYDYLIGCEDYADIPCDLEKLPEDSREEPGVKLTYDRAARKITAQTGQPGCTVSVIAEPPGTKVGEFTSTMAAGSASGSSSTASVEIRMAVPEGAAYEVEAVKGDEILCYFQAYYKDGRFRTSVKLGSQEAKEQAPGSSIAGSAWNREGQEDYGLYRYNGCSELKDIQGPGTVCRHFRYKDVNMAYSGDGATEGKNTLEYDVSLEDMYQFRDNGFTKEKTETKYTEDNEPYECRVRYGFHGWDMEINGRKKNKLHQEKQQKGTRKVYFEAKEVGAISDHTTEDISTYQTAEPIHVLPGLPGSGRSAQGTWEGTVRAAAQGGAHAKEYINLTPKWDACPTITVAPGEKLEFYEGEEVTKEGLTSRLIAHDNEDNRDMKAYPDLNDKLRIVKVSCPEPENRSQAAYEKTYENDVPAEFLLDTYYLKLEEDETVDVLVTFAVTDSAGNTTEEEIPVKVKYNHYPEISSEDAFYYLKEEANRGEITETALLGRASAEDEEDGDITVKLMLKDFDPQETKMQTQPKAEFDVTYQVTDAFRKTSYKTVKLMVWDGDAAAAEAPKYYVRYISEKYLDTLEENSTWREPENMAYLKAMLRNETPMETWKFTHEDVEDVQGWITAGGGGNWKTGREANREFLARFARCRQ